jgi:hypothetical protein
MRAPINNIDLVGEIHVVKARQAKIDVQQYGVFLLKVMIGILQHIILWKLQYDMLKIHNIVFF